MYTTSEDVKTGTEITDNVMGSPLNRQNSNYFMIYQFHVWAIYPKEIISPS